jgi:hypothetical protein
MPGPSYWEKNQCRRSRANVNGARLIVEDTFRKYDSTCLAVVSAQLCKPTTSGNGSGEVHCLAARKTDMVRFDVFVV